MWGVLKEIASWRIVFYVEFKILIKMLNNHVQMKVGGINLQLVDLIIRMFVYFLQPFYSWLLRRFVVFKQKTVLFAKGSKINCYAPFSRLSF